MNIVIIGNGFDIMHKMETSYENFTDSLRYENNSVVNYLTKVHTIQTWIDCEEAILEISTALSEIYNIFQGRKSLVKVPILKNEINRVFSNKSVIKFFDLMFDKDVNKMDFIFIDELLQKISNGGLYYDFSKYIDIINIQINELKNLLKHHILMQKEKAIELENFKKYIIDGDINSTNTVCINFNYTNTINEVYGLDLQVINLHGKCEEEIIFGHYNIESKLFANFNKQNQLLLNNLHYKNELIRFISRYESNLGDTYSKLDFHFIGHSIGDADQAILGDIFDIISISTKSRKPTKFNSCGSHIFYYSKNKDDLINKVDALNKIRNSPIHESLIWKQIEYYDTTKNYKYKRFPVYYIEKITKTISAY